MMTTLDNVKRYIESFPHTKMKFAKGEYSFNDPENASSDSHSFTLFNISADGEFANYKYFASKDNQTGGTLYDLAKKWGVEIVGDGRLPVTNSKRKYESLKDYAESHALTVEQCTDNRIGWIEQGGKPILRIHTKSGYRNKLMDGSQKWYTEAGYVNHWYRGSDAVKIANDSNLDYLVIVNAEISTVACQVRGIPATTTTTGENGIAKMMPELRKHWTGMIYIALDCDDAGISAAKAIHEADKNTAIIDLMLTKDSGGDAADFCLLHGDDSKNALERLFKKQNPVKVINTHETDIHTTDKVLDALTDEMTGKTKIKERAYPFPIVSFRKFGGFMRNSKSGKVDLYIGGSGTGKTQLLETLDELRNAMRINVMSYGSEWTEKELMMRRITRHSMPHISYDEIQEHLMWVAYNQEGVKDEDNFGTKFTDEQMKTYLKTQAYIKRFIGKTEYFGGEPTLEDTIEAMKCGLERQRRNGKQVLCISFDYAQLLVLKNWSNSGNRAEDAFEEVKKFAIDYNVHVDMASQINKDSSKAALDGKQITADDAHFIRKDKANAAFTLDRQYHQDGDGDYIETPCFWLTSGKASLGGPIDGFKYARVPMTMIPQRLKFETRLDGINNWTLNPKFWYVKGNKYYRGTNDAPDPQSELDKVLGG